MTIIMTIALLIGIIFLIIGLMLIAAPDTLYELNKSIIKFIYKMNEYLNKKLFKFNSYLNNVVVNNDEVLTYRLIIAICSLFIGIVLIYSSYYYSQQGTLPPMIKGFFTNLYAHFQSPDAT